MTGLLPASSVLIINFYTLIIFFNGSKQRNLWYKESELLLLHYQRTGLINISIRLHLDMKRREFFKNLAHGLFSFFGVGLIAYPILRFLSHTKQTIKTVIFNPSETLLKINYKPGIYLIRKENGFEAISDRCTHLGCTVAYNERKSEFHCPCHGTIYDKNGKRLSGPAKKSLSLLPVRRKKTGDLIITLKE